MTIISYRGTTTTATIIMIIIMVFGVSRAMSIPIRRIMGGRVLYRRRYAPGLRVRTPPPYYASPRGQLQITLHGGTRFRSSSAAAARPYAYYNDIAILFDFDYFLFSLVPSARHQIAPMTI